MDWLSTFEPQWAATMGYPVEEELTAGQPELIGERQAHTTELAYYFWHTFPDVPWAWTPTIQGWTPEQYRAHAPDAPAHRDDAARLWRGKRLSHGHWDTVPTCRGTMIRQIVQAVADELPPGTHFHLWGTKLAMLQSRLGVPPQVASCDSAAWNGLFGRDRTAYQQRGDPSKRQFVYQRLGQYRAKVELALEQPRQFSLFD